MQQGFPIGSGTLVEFFEWAEGELNPRHQDFQGTHRAFITVQGCSFETVKHWVLCSSLYTVRSP